MMTDPRVPDLLICEFAAVPFSFPLHDWQFWAATGVFLAAAAWLLKGVLPIPFLSRRHRRKKHETRATLTIGGEAVKREK